MSMWYFAIACRALRLSVAPATREARSFAIWEFNVVAGEGLLVIVVVGLIAGWLAGQVVRGTGFGIVGDLIIGVAGAFIGGWLLPQLGIELGTGIVAAVINATIGALVLLWIIKLVRGGNGWGGWGRRWGGWGARWGRRW